MTDLDESYAWCRHVCRKSKSSFFSSFALLEPERRKAMYALYAFSRISDDLSDSSRAAQDRRASLEAWSELLALLDASPTPESSRLPEFAALWPALRDTVRRYGIPLQLLQDIVRGTSMDLDPKQPEDWSELQNYCYHVASAVGLACTHIWGKTAQIPEQAAIHCGFAFQLTNILRDVAEDAKSGRIYLPKALFTQYGVGLEDWLAGSPTGNWRRLIKDAAQEAVGFYASGWPTIHALSPRSQRMFSLIWRTYRSLLEDVVDHPDRLWRPRKVRLSPIRKAYLLSTHFVPTLYASLAEPCPKTH